jgi:dipeptidyl-peptidase-4
MGSRADAAASTSTDSQTTDSQTTDGQTTDSQTTDGQTTDSAVQGLSFPRLLARTGSFRFGTPRVVGFAHDGATVVFLRSRSGTDRSGLLWAYDVATATERLLADPVDTLAGEQEQLSAAERSRRERSRETGSGIVAATLDAAGSTVAFTLSSRLFTIDLGPAPDADRGPGPARELPAAGPVLDPRLDPAGRWVAYSDGRSLRLTAVDGSGDRPWVEPDSPTVSWGVAEFNAAEDMPRSRGFWWAPDSSAVLTARVEEAAVALRTAADPSRPLQPARSERYPFAGTPNPDVSLWWVPVLGGTAIGVDWDRGAFPYLTAVTWSPAGPPLIGVQSRDQRDERILSFDVARAAAVAGGSAPRPGQPAPSVDAHEVLQQQDPRWVELFAGVPAWLPGGRVLTVVADPETDTYRLAADGVAFSPAGLQVEAVLDVGRDDILATVQDDPRHSDVALLRLDGTVRLLTGPHAEEQSADHDLDDHAGGQVRLDRPGVHGARRHGPTVVIERSGPEQVGSTLVVRHDGLRATTISSRALAPSFLPVPESLLLGPARLRGWLFLPTDVGGDLEPGSVPVLLSPYGGPGAAMVRAAARRAVVEQWWADQGFAVLVVDNRGTPGRGPAFDRTVHHDFAGITLDDQVEALTEVAAAHPELDLSRVAIHGWSFGGYLAALAVLRRPDVFAAAVAGAPPTDWRLYSTFYTERYLGHPDTEPEVYARNGLLGRAADLRRPLMLVHGLADDNVLVAHTLELSAALLRAGRPHTVLPLSGITHMTSDEDVAENLLLLQLDFLRTALGMPTP